MKTWKENKIAYKFVLKMVCPVRDASLAITIHECSQRSVDTSHEEMHLQSSTGLLIFKCANQSCIGWWRNEPGLRHCGGG